jgi:hypothetical protein
MPGVQIEYYDPGLLKEGSTRHFDYSWPGDYAVDSMEVVVQQPVDARDMRISPSLGSGKQGNDGLLYYVAEVGSLEAGQSFTISLDYQKETDALSATNLNVAPSAPLNDSTLGRMNLSTRLPWILGALGVLLIVGGGVWYWQSGRRKSGPASRQRHKPAAAREAAPTEDFVYCSQCGKRAAPGDRFCRTCGSQLRTG